MNLRHNLADMPVTMAMARRRVIEYLPVASLQELDVSGTVSTVACGWREYCFMACR